MRSDGLSERYVKALSGMELPKGLTLAKLTEEIGALATIYDGAPELREILENPSFSDDERKRVIDTLVKRLKVSRLCRNFACMLVDKQRSRLLPEIARQLQGVLDGQAGVTRAQVTSAVPLKKSHEKALNKALSELRQGPVRIELDVDPTLIGGLVVEMEGTVYDGSVKKRIDDIRALMLKEAR